MCEWHLFCGECDFFKICPFFCLKCPRFLVEIFQNAPVFVESSIGTLIVGHYASVVTHLF